MTVTLIVGVDPGQINRQHLGDLRIGEVVKQARHRS